MKKILGVAAVAAMLALTGCSSTEGKPAAAPSVEPAKASATPEPTPTEPEQEKSVRGNLVKQVGEGANIFNTETDEDTVRFSVDAISVDPGCTAEFAQAPENGHFVILDVSIETTPALADDPYGSTGFYFGADSMKIIAPNGTTSNVSPHSAAAYMCLTEPEVLPVRFGPAEKATGKVVLDSEVPTGTIVISAYGQDAWEYNF